MLYANATFHLVSVEQNVSCRISHLFLQAGNTCKIHAELRESNMTEVQTENSECFPTMSS